MQFIHEFPRGECGMHDSISFRSSLVDQKKNTGNIVAKALEDACNDANNESGQYRIDEDTKSCYDPGMGELYDRAYCFFSIGLYSKIMFCEVKRSVSLMKGIIESL